ncbi:hypothetical protein IMZ11_31890 [Microtetraspora sp. AC03309]|nr:hypothetical protein [Microtetraspora sp. AC03309]
MDVLHGDLAADAEDAHEVDRVGGVGGFIEDSVAAEPAGADADALEERVGEVVGDGWMGGVGRGDPADRQVGVGGAGPEAAPFT